MRSGFELVCIAVGACQLCLLSVALALRPDGASAFVSAELMRSPGFSLALTCTVVFQIAACAVYTAGVGAAAHGSAVAVGAAGSFAALCGWTVLVSWNLHSAPHAWGVLLFLVGSTAYTLSMFAASRSVSQRALAWGLVAVYAAAFALIIVFIASYVVGNVAVSTAAEWGGFMCTSAAFVLFFATHGR